MMLCGRYACSVYQVQLLEITLLQNETENGKIITSTLSTGNGGGIGRADAMDQAIIGDELTRHNYYYDNNEKAFL